MNKYTRVKLDLENFIFSRAASLRVRIQGRKGALFTACLDPYLQVLTYIYNRVYKQENLVGCDDIHDNVWKNTPSEKGGIHNGWILPSLQNLTN
ncbi:MAG: hypothetical protein IKP96_00160 [Elusimicrobiaceae bacterium]|nr:hypothetical protein [Elusimicrobiaceae bacterium]